VIAVALRRSPISRALARRLRWLDVTNDIPTEQRRRAMMATAGVFLLTVGPTLALVSLALPAGSSEDARAIVLVSLAGYALAALLLAAFDRLPEWSFHVGTIAGIGLIAAAIHFAGDLQPVYTLFLAAVPLYAAYFFGWRVALGQSALAGVACGFALEPGGGGVEYAALAIPVLVAPLSLVVFLRRRERGLTEALLASQEELRQAQKLEAIGRLAGGVAHEFNNALTAIGGYAELVTRAATDDRQRADAHQIVVATARAAALTSSLLAVSGRHVLQPAPLDLNESLRGLEPRLRAACGERVELRLEPDEALDAIHADSGLVEQVILALVANACDAMPEGGVLRIATGGAVVAEGDRGPEGLPPGRYATLAVADTGVGIAPEVREHLFDPFFTTKGGGPAVGLGLASVQGIVRQSGGAVQVASVPGAGAVFRVWLPVLGAAAGEPPPAYAQPQEDGETQALLVVDDDDAVRLLARRILQDAGYRVVEAAHGAAALELVQADPAAFALVLTDVAMPVLDGPGLALALAELVSPPPVLFMSGYADRAFVESRLAGLGAGFLPKPFTIAELTEAVAGAVGGGPVSGSPVPGA